MLLRGSIDIIFIALVMIIKIISLKKCQKDFNDVNKV